MVATIAVLLASPLRLELQLVAKALGEARKGDIEVRGGVYEAYDLLPAVGRFSPDVVILDLRWPDAAVAIKSITQGLKASVLACAPPLPLIEEGAPLEAIQAGALGCVSTRDTNTEELAGAVRMVSKGEGHLSSQGARELVLSLQRNPVRPVRNPDFPQVDLTAREHQVLELVGEGMTNKEIAKTLVISEHTARAHVRSLMQKLNLDNRTSLAIYAVRQGIAQSRRR